MNVEKEAPSWEPTGRTLPRILLVDDDAMVRETLAPFVEARLRVVVRTASSGEEALEHIARETFDIVLADHAMPGMTGVELMARLRQDHPLIARVIVTGYPERGVREAAHVVGGVHAFVVKPYSTRWMIWLLRALIDDGAHLPPLKLRATVDSTAVRARFLARRTARTPAIVL